MQKHGKSNNGFQDYLKNPNVNSLFLNENDPGEVYNLLTKLDERKASHTYGISSKFIQITIPFITIPSTEVFNKSFRGGVFPDKLKLAKVIPIHKAESKAQVNNYRPISVLPILRKKFLKNLCIRELCPLS